ncbi:MAG: hypothetical protein ACTSRP_09935 [Candidatus Helarchaeota archaeon]
MNLYEDTKKILEGIECSDFNERGYVTSNYLRNMLDLSRKLDDIDEFILRIGYMTAKNMGRRTHEIENFYSRLINYIKSEKIIDIKMISKILEYIIMHFTVRKAGLEV